MKTIMYLSLGCFVLAAGSVVASLLIGNVLSDGIIAIGIGFALVPFLSYAIFGLLGGIKANSYNRSGIIFALQIALFSYIPLIVVYILASKSSILNEILTKLNTSSESTLQISSSIDIATIIQSFIPFLVIATIMGKLGEVIAKKRSSSKAESNTNVYTG